MKPSKNKAKLVIVPALLLSSALFMTACGSGDKNHNPEPTNPPVSAENVSTSSMDEFVAPPQNLDDKYKAYYAAPSTLNEAAWAYFKGVGSTTYKEDDSTRAISSQEWENLRADQDNFKKFDKVRGEMMSDVEQSALNISSFLEHHPNAAVQELSNNPELVINRFPNVGTTLVEKDPATNYYFVVFTPNSASEGYGIIVPQKGITPEFQSGSSGSVIPSEEPIIPPTEEPIP